MDEQNVDLPRPATPSPTPLDSFNSTTHTFFYPDSSWPFILQDAMARRDGLPVDSNSTPINNNNNNSTQTAAVGIPSTMASLSTPSFVTGLVNADSTSQPDSIPPVTSMGVSPTMSSSIATLHLADFGNGVGTNESEIGTTHSAPLDIRTSMGTAIAPLPTADLAFQTFDSSATLLTSTSMPIQIPLLTQQQSFTQNPMNFPSGFDVRLQASLAEDYAATTRGQLHNALNALLVPSTMDSMTDIQAFPSSDPQFGYNDYNTMINWPSLVEDMPAYANPNVTESPESHWLGPRSMSSHSDQSWSIIDVPQERNSFDSVSDTSNVVSPQILHVRTDSNSSHHSDNPPPSANSIGSYEEIFPITPEPEAHLDVTPGISRGVSLHPHDQSHGFSSPPLASPMPHSSAPTPLVPMTTSHSPRETGSSSSSSGGSPKSKRRVSPSGVTKTITKKKTTGGTGKEKSEKRVGRRRGPLRPEQRQQAHEIRKLRACLRCKFLKKVCDPGDPCVGCQPSHARLWQVPCTRIDIKDIAFFLKDWNADYERHISLGFSIANIKGFSTEERVLYITHDYGFVMPIYARQVYVRDDKCFGVDWAESIHETPRLFEVTTARLSAGIEGISRRMVSEYLDLHLDEGFERFVDEYFEGTFFLTELLKTIYRFYRKTNMLVVRKGLKLVLAYALTLHITMISGLSEEEAAIGKIDDPGSRYYGQTCAPVMINFQVKKAMADMWRELMKDVLEELSALYSSVYNGEKLKNWPTIFILAALILAVWELMQFDSHYRDPDEGAVSKFCNEMESVPVGVIVGLFSAISTKLPGFLDWDTRKHGNVWDNNSAVCDTMTEVREHVKKHESYLKSRNETKFDREDFDCLSNKFLSKLVIRS